MSMGRYLLVCALASLSACAGPDSAAFPIPIASIETFEAEVQPHIAVRCGSGGCHGRPERVLAFFVPGAYRRDPERTYFDEELTTSELEENARQLSAFALETRAENSLAVRKPLAIEAGGLWHGGGATFADAHDPACEAISEWLDSRRPPVDGGTP